MGRYLVEDVVDTVNIIHHMLVHPPLNEMKGIPSNA